MHDLSLHVPPAGGSQLGDSDVPMVAFGTQQTTVGAFMASYFDYHFSFIWWGRQALGRLLSERHSRRAAPGAEARDEGTAKWGSKRHGWEPRGQQRLCLPSAATAPLPCLP